MAKDRSPKPGPPAGQGTMVARPKALAELADQLKQVREAEEADDATRRADPLEVEDATRRADSMHGREQEEDDATRRYGQPGQESTAADEPLTAQVAKRSRAAKPKSAAKRGGAASQKKSAKAGSPQSTQILPPEEGGRPAGGSKAAPDRTAAPPPEPKPAASAPRKKGGAGANPNTVLLSALEDPKEYLPEGTQVGDFVVEYKVGEGGMATIYAARNEVLGKRAALKVLSLDLSRDPVMVGRFAREARALNALNHVNVVEVYSFGRLPDGRSYFLMEWLGGLSLADRLELGTVPLGEGLYILFGILEALDAVHACEIIHRDLKPANVMLANRVQKVEDIKLVDFGVAKVDDANLADEVRTKAGMLMGTPHYVSPEQARGQKVDHRADTYAFGIIAFEVAVGRRPFEADNTIDALFNHLEKTPPKPTSMWKDCPIELEEIILQMLAKKPDRRPSLQDVREAFEHVQENYDLALQAPGPKNKARGRPGSRAKSLPKALRSNPKASGARAKEAQPLRTGGSAPSLSAPSLSAPGLSAPSVSDVRPQPRADSSRGSSGGSVLPYLVVAAVAIGIVLGVVFLRPTVGESTSKKAVVEDTETSGTSSDWVRER